MNNNKVLKNLNDIYSKGLELIKNDKIEDLLKHRYLFDRPEFLKKLKKDFEYSKEFLPKDLLEIEKKVIENLEQQVNRFKKRYNNKEDVVTLNKEINKLVDKYLETVKESDTKDLYIEILTDTENSKRFVDYLYNELKLENNSINLHYKGSNIGEKVQHTYTMKSSDYEKFCKKFIELKEKHKNMFSGRIKMDFVPPLLTHEITNNDINALAEENGGFINSRNLGLGSMYFSYSDSLNQNSDILPDEELKLNINKAFHELFKNYSKSQNDGLFKKCNYVYSDEASDLDGEDVNIKTEIMYYNKLNKSQQQKNKNN
tara:strand:+ start:14807 stop:15751 length:945 start_codon:yes stop_codon:yes gene_type:complete